MDRDVEEEKQAAGGQRDGWSSVSYRNFRGYGGWGAGGCLTHPVVLWPLPPDRETVKR